MSGWKLRAGNAWFRGLREEQCFYMDKTALIGEFLATGPSRGTIITRPHRFGGTLTMTMLRDFFDIRQDSRAIFDGLAISEDKALCDRWMNQYPAVYANFWTNGWLTFDEALASFYWKVAHTCSDFSFLRESEAVDKRDRQFLKKIAHLKDRDFHPDCLKVLCRALYAYYGRRVILLVDSYEDALLCAQYHGHYREMAQCVNSVFDAVLNDNEYLEFAILKGSLPVTGASGLDAFAGCACYDISDKAFADKIGFTAQEVDELADRTGLAEERETIKEWYGGICFGDMEMYSPRDVLGYLGDVLENYRLGSPRRFWVKTFVNAAVDSMWQTRSTHVGARLDSLLSGGSTEARIADTFACDNPYKDGEEYLWSLLYHLGHLAKASPQQEKPDGRHTGYSFSLVIPNKQLRNLFTIPIMYWLYSLRIRVDTWEFFEAFWANDDAAVSRLLTSLLEETDGLYDACEMFLHSFFYWLFQKSGKGYAIQWGTIGRTEADVVVCNQFDKRIVAIQIVRAGSEEDLTALAEKALSQLKDNAGCGVEKRYGEDCPVTYWGLAVYRKHCVFTAG